MSTQLTYAILFVADMDQSVAFYRDLLGLTLKFASPGWSEFVTGETTLALHPMTATDVAGTIQLGLRVPDLHGFYTAMTGQGVKFTAPPHDEGGVVIARFLTPDGAECSVSAG